MKFLRQYAELGIRNLAAVDAMRFTFAPGYFEEGTLKIKMFDGEGAQQDSIPLDNDPPMIVVAGDIVSVDGVGFTQETESGALMNRTEGERTIELVSIEKHILGNWYEVPADDLYSKISVEITVL